MMMGLGVAAWRRANLCEINDKGIRAPSGTWRLSKLVSWQELVRLEIIHNEEFGICDYFVLYDRAGRRRIDARSWMGEVRSADRTRIFRALRARFPGKAKTDSSTEPALVSSGSAAVWDRELDG